MSQPSGQPHKVNDQNDESRQPTEALSSSRIKFERPEYAHGVYQPSSNCSPDQSPQRSQYLTHLVTSLSV